MNDRFWSAIASVRNLFAGAWKYALAHKVISGILLIAILGGGYYEYGRLTSTSGQTTYTLGTVATGTVISLISGSGQVSPSNQVTINPKASGSISKVLVRDGQSVSAGQALAYIDATDEYNALQSAQADLKSAQISLQKIQEPPTTLSVIQAQNALSQATTDLSLQYDNGYNEAASTFADLPTAMTGLKNILFGNDKTLGGVSFTNLDYYSNQAATFDSRALSFRDDVKAKYQTALDAYTSALDTYKATSRSASTSTIADLVDTTYATTKDVADAVQSSTNLIQLYKDALTKQNITPSATADTHLSSLNSFTSSLSPDISSLLSIKNSFITDQQSIDEKQASLTQLQAGADTLDLQSAELNVEQKQTALAQAQTNLDNYTIRAPISGTLADLNLHTGDTVGASTNVSTLITTDEIADLSLNEVDAAKVSAGQKVTLTFDAIPDLTLAGIVANVSPLGTVTQGVVSYDVKISFTTQDARVKAGMTVNADIQTAVHQNVLTVPSGAVKTQSGQTYVQVFNPPLTQTGTTGILSATPPQNIPVTVGISDDTNTEITSGLTAGEQIVVRTSGGTAAVVTTGAAGARAGGFGGGGGGAIRIP
jgi:HlyD family secretion protein